MSEHAVSSGAPPELSSRPRRERRSGEHRQSAEVRERILNATLAVAATHGYRGLTIARVSAASGMPAGSVYWHFASKDKLLRSAMDLSYERHRDAVLIVGPKPGETVESYIPRIMVDMGRVNKPMEFWQIGVALVADETAPEVETQQRFLEIRREVLALYASWWRTLMPGSIDAPSGYRPEDFAHLLLVIQDGFSMTLAAGESLPDRLPAFTVALRAIAGLPPAVSYQ